MTKYESRTDSTFMMEPVTLNGGIKRMTLAGLISEATDRPDPEMDDQRRRYYRLTGLGARAMDSETARLEHLARAGRQRRAATRRGAEGEGS